MHPNTPPAPPFEKVQKLIVVEQWWMSLAKPENYRINRKQKETNALLVKRKTEYNQNTRITIYKSRLQLKSWLEVG